jgi:hypothetical protein
MVSFTQSLSISKQLALAALVLMAIFAPSLIGRPFASSEAEPALVALFCGIPVALVSYFVLRALLPELEGRTITSAATVLGLIAAHVYVFKAMDTTVSLQMFALFTFIFFLHVDEGLL